MAACLIKLVPVLELPVWLWLWTGGIALIKMINIVSGCVVKKKIITPHTVMNKVTGVLLFALPLTLPTVELKHSAPFVCTVATIAAIQEGHFMWRFPKRDHTRSPSPRGRRRDRLSL